MAATKSEKVGRGPCPSIDKGGKPCRGDVTYRRSSGGFLTHKCDQCDSTGYCEPGGSAHAARMASLTEVAEKIASAVHNLDMSAATKPEDKPRAHATPPKKIANSVFSLADL